VRRDTIEAMSDISAGTSVTDVPSRQAFEARTSDGRVAGFAAYSRTADVVTLTHTVVEEEFRGQSVGDQLARVALEQFRVEGLKVDAQCSFIADFIEKNPEYQDLLV
jgi:predicted GNAT family acetyltransferase